MKRTGSRWQSRKRCLWAPWCRSCWSCHYDGNFHSIIWFMRSKHFWHFEWLSSSVTIQFRTKLYSVWPVHSLPRTHKTFEEHLSCASLRNIHVTAGSSTSHFCDKSYSWRRWFQQRWVRCLVEIWHLFLFLRKNKRNWSLWNNTYKSCFDYKRAQKLARIGENSNFFRFELRALLWCQ